MAAAQPEFSPKMFVVPVLMLSVKFLKIDLSDYVPVLRVLYAVATFATVGVFVALRSMARRKAEPGNVTVTEKLPSGPVTKKLSTADYDVKECDKKLQQAAIGCLVVAFIHYKWGSPMPLLFQSIMQLVNLTDDPLVQIHFLHKKPIGKLARPFKVANPLADLIEGNTSADDQNSSSAKKKN
ncbi:hypothetical protein CTAYLR_009440 [Chrysophaeum taylorii]|uniref:Inorganic phosphate transporter n=1 Tax=Chrysophaeum taylorii TaxID=2483200 RepID=A0AAD7XID2_9STRA|nr:hypothetical protein CTAYLR_009440 [Chrysophaeum taylorii]